MADLPIPSVRAVTTALPPADVAPRSAGTGLGETFGRALEDVNALQARAQEVATAVASGARVDMARALVTIEQANISFQFALQVRNKLLEAYQEIMRMQV